MRRMGPRAAADRYVTAKLEPLILCALLTLPLPVTLTRTGQQRVLRGAQRLFARVIYLTLQIARCSDLLATWNAVADTGTFYRGACVLNVVTRCGRAWRLQGNGLCTAARLAAVTFLPRFVLFGAHRCVYHGRNGAECLVVVEVSD